MKTEYQWSKERRYWNGFDMKLVATLLDRDSKQKPLSITEDYYLRCWKTMAEPVAKMLERVLDAK